MYLNLFNGRTDPEAEQEKLFNGPIIGPVNISFTLGSIKLHPLYDWGLFKTIPIIDYTLYFEGVYYEDFEIVNEQFAEKSNTVKLQYDEIECYINIKK